MKTIQTFLISFFVFGSMATFGQTESPGLVSKAVSLDTQFKQKDTSYWVDNFRQFREALYQRDKAKAKVFFNLPINDDGNEIWNLACPKKKMGAAGIPFTERDFDKYFDNLFSARLVKCLLKIKTEDLYRKGKSTSPELQDGPTTYIL